MGIKCKRGRYSQPTSKMNDIEDDENDEDNSNVFSLDNKIYFFSNVSISSITLLIKCIKDANGWCGRNNKSRIFLYIHSLGGDVYAGISGMMHIAKSANKITTVVDGFVASAATFMLLGAERRHMTRFSKVLIHQIRIDEFTGKHCDMVDEIYNVNDLMKSCNEIYLEKTSISKKKLEKIIRKETNLDASFCLSHGIVTKIIEY